MAESLYRPARPAAAWWNVSKTLLEILFLWFVFLIALPIGISIVEVELAIQRFPGQPILAVPGLILFTLLGLWAALTLAIAGHGTPLPVDEARRLVVRGPYAYVRNPLVIAALGQGASMGVMFGSIPVLVYVFLLAVWWYYYGRRVEEQHLRQRYGKAWDKYAKEVRAFRPRMKPYGRA